jgi:hypothetical protein
MCTDSNSDINLHPFFIEVLSECKDFHINVSNQIID